MRNVKLLNLRTIKTAWHTLAFKWIAFVAPFALIAIAGCAQRTTQPGAQPPPALPAESSATPAEARYLAQLDALIPEMAAERIPDRAEAQQAWEQTCFAAGRPEAEAERAAVCRAMLMRLGPATPEAARVWLLRQLERLSAEESVPGLASLLRDENARIRELARRALQQNPSDAAAETLRMALETTSDAAWRVALINALAARGDSLSAPFFIVLSRDEANPAVAEAAIAALGDVATLAAIQHLTRELPTPNGERRRQIAAALLRCAARAAANEQPLLAARIARLLLATPLCSHQHASALAVLAQSDPEAAHNVLKAIVKGEVQPELRSFAITLLVASPDPEAAAVVCDAAPTLPPDEQVILLASLAQRGDIAGRPAVSAALRSAEPDVQIAAVEALASLGGVEDVAALLDLSADASGDLAAAIQRVLVRLPGPEVDAALLDATRREADVAGRPAAIRALAARGNGQLLPLLLEMPQFWSPPDRTAAFKVLAERAGETDLPRVLILHTREQDEDVRIAADKAVVALCQRRAPASAQAEPVLSAYTEHSTSEPRARLLRLLSRLQTPAALETLRTAVNDHDPEVRDAAVRTLAEWKDAAALEDLREIAASSPDEAHRVLALRGFIRLVRAAGEPDPQARLTQLTAALELATRPDEVRLVLAALPAAACPAALELAQQHLATPALQNDAAVAIAQLARRLAAQHPAEVQEAFAQADAAEITDSTRRQVQEARDLIAEYAGYITAWAWCGPFSEDGQAFEQVFAMPLGPEASPAAADWRPLTAHQADNPWIFDLRTLSGCSDCCIYARTTLVADEAAAAELLIGSDDAVKVWLNGALVHENLARRAVQPDQDRAVVQLQPGANELMLKIVQSSGGWAFCCGVRQPDGAPLANVRFASPSAGPIR